jgi:hypothetical protein
MAPCAPNHPVFLNTTLRVCPTASSSVCVTARARVGLSLRGGGGRVVEDIWI